MCMTTLRDLEATFCDYLTSIRNYRSTTVKSYKETFRTFHKALPDIEHPNQVSPILAQQFFFWGRSQHQWKPSTFITHHKRLNVFHAWIVKNGVAATNPFSGIEKPRLEKKLPTRLSRQQAMDLLEAAANLKYDYTFLRFRNHAVFATFLYCGLRKHELLHLTCADVDLDNLIICVRQGKGNKDRVVPMPYPLKSILLRYLAERERLGKTCPEFFASLNRDCGFTGSGLKRLIERVIQATGTPFYPHMLRHTFATLMIEGGCDIYSLSKMMGHNDIKTTTIYLSASVEHLRAEMTKHPLNYLA